MKSPAWRILALLTLTIVVVTMATDANAARRSSLAGNQFIDDHDDMFAFPQLLIKYKNSVILDWAPGTDDGSGRSGLNGNGSVTFGDNWVWQFNTGRNDYLNNTAFWAWGGFDQINALATALGNGTPSSGVQWWDLGVATTFGNNPWGLTISWAANEDKVEAIGGGGVTSDTSTSFFSLQLGTTLGPVELAGEFGTGSFKDSVDPTFDVSFSNYSLLARGNIYDAGGMDWRWIAAFAGGSTKPDAAGAEKLSSSAFRGSFGPVWGDEGRWVAAAYISFDYVKNDTPPGGGADANTTKFEDKVFTLPGYNVAMEYYITSWLAARGGLLSRYEMITETEVNTTGNGEVKSREFVYLWTAGLGVDMDNWGLDLALDQENLFSGYVFGNGDQSGDTIGYITAWLTW